MYYHQCTYIILHKFKICIVWNVLYLITPQLLQLCTGCTLPVAPLLPPPLSRSCPLRSLSNVEHKVGKIWAWLHHLGETWWKMRSIEDRQSRLLFWCWVWLFSLETKKWNGEVRCWSNQTQQFNDNYWYECLYHFDRLYNLISEGIADRELVLVRVVVASHLPNMSINMNGARFVLAFQLSNWSLSNS